MALPVRIYRVFLSSTWREFKNLREQVMQVLRANWYLPVGMEYFGPSDQPPTLEWVREYLDDSDAMILIVGADYGSRSAGGRSFVESEYDAAKKNGVPVLAILYGAGDYSWEDVLEKRPDVEAQALFVRKLKKETVCVTCSDISEFPFAISKVIARLPGVLRADGGLVRGSELTSQVTRLQALLRYEAESSQRERLKGKDLAFRITQLRRLVGINSELVEATISVRYTQKSLGHLIGVPAMAEIKREDRALADLVDKIATGFANRPVLIDVATKLIARLKSKLADLMDSENGYTPQDTAEVEVVIRSLFSPSLRALSATAIQFDPKVLTGDPKAAQMESYLKYWDNSDVGRVFKEHNETFLANGGHVRRLFLCESLAQAVKQDWFAQHVLTQVRLGAEVKVIEISTSDVSTYADFGIYQHDIDGDPSTAQDADEYLLLARPELNARGELRPSLMSPPPHSYRERFESWWRQQKDPLKAIDTGSDCGAHKPMIVDRPARLNDILNNRVILRRMRRLDTGQQLLTPADGFVRKYEWKYAQALARHVSEGQRRFAHVIYLGDTYSNDGGVIRNLQALRLPFDVAGFVCDPSLGIHGLWFHDVLYSDTWTDLVAFMDGVKGRLTQDTLAIVDIDQTLWAAKGEADQPLHQSRINAITSLLNRYVTKNVRYADHCKRVASDVYREIKGSSYFDLTLDNEDYKAAVVVCVSLGLLQDPLQPGLNIAFDIDQYDPERVKTNLQEILRRHKPGPGRGREEVVAVVLRALGEMLALTAEDTYGRRGIDVGVLREDLRRLFSDLRDGVPAPFAAFRAHELQETLRLASIDEPSRVTEAITINRAAWDCLAFLRQKDVPILALSDRPDECTLNESCSLLDTPMLVYGRSIAEELDALD